MSYLMSFVAMLGSALGALILIYTVNHFDSQQPREQVPPGRKVAA